MNKDIKVFTTPTCVYCHMLKRFLGENNIEYENIDLTQHPKWINRMVAKSGQMGVPQMWVGNEVIVGFNVPAIKHSLEL